MKRSLSILALTALAATTDAGELRRDLVPANVSWIGHFDFEGLQRTNLWNQLLTHEEFELEDAMGELDEIRREIGIDPLQDIRSITVFGTGMSEEETVAMVRTTSAIDLALDRFAEEDEYRRTSRGGYVLHSWDNEGYAYLHEGQGDERVLLVAGDPATLARTADVLNGRGLSLMGTATPRVTAVPSSESFVFFAAAEGIPGLHEIEPASQIANLAQGIVFQMGEARGELFLTANVLTADIDAALNLSDVFDGLLALAKLAMATEDLPSSLRDLTRSLQVETRGNEVWIEFRYSVQALFQAFEDLAEEAW